MNVPPHRRCLHLSRPAIRPEIHRSARAAAADSARGSRPARGAGPRTSARRQLRRTARARRRSAGTTARSRIRRSGSGRRCARRATRPRPPPAPAPSSRHGARRLQVRKVDHCAVDRYEDDVERPRRRAIRHQRPWKSRVPEVNDLAAAPLPRPATRPADRRARRRRAAPSSRTARPRPPPTASTHGPRQPCAARGSALACVNPRFSTSAPPGHARLVDDRVVRGQGRRTARRASV